MSRLRKRSRPASDECAHPAYYLGMCVSCGTRLEPGLSPHTREDELPSKTLVVGGGSSLVVSKAEAERIEQCRLETLIRSRYCNLKSSYCHLYLKHAQAAGLGARH